MIKCNIKDTNSGGGIDLDLSELMLAPRRHCYIATITLLWLHLPHCYMLAPRSLCYDYIALSTMILAGHHFVHLLMSSSTFHLVQCAHHVMLGKYILASSFWFNITTFSNYQWAAQYTAFHMDCVCGEHCGRREMGWHHEHLLKAISANNPPTQWHMVKHVHKTHPHGTFLVFGMTNCFLILLCGGVFGHQHVGHTRWVQKEPIQKSSRPR